MKKTFLALRLILSAVMCFAILSVGGTTDITSLFDVNIFSSLDGIALASLLPATLADPAVVKQWSQKYFERVQSKSIFDESYTGTAFAKDGPKKSDLIKAAPITVVNDLQNRSGNVVTHTMIEPMFQDSEARLNYARLKQQVREGTEKSLNRKFVKLPIASAFWGIKEEDVLIGKQESGMAQMISLMTKGLSDNVSAYMDDDIIEAFFTGYSRHLYTTIAELNDVADQSPVLGNGDLGVLDTMREHPNTYAWTESGLIKAPSNSAQHIAETFNLITSAAKPSASLLNSISLAVKVRKIPGAVLTGGKFKSGKSMVKCIVDPITMQQLRDDTALQGTINSAYQATGDEHPFIAQGDILWGNLWITEEEKLLDDAFSNKYSFDGEGYTESGTPDVVHSEAAVIDITGTKGTVSRAVTVSKGLRYYHGSDTTGIGAAGAGADKIGNILVLGANSLARVPGPVRRLTPRTTDDYRRIQGLGSEHIFGHKRLDFIDGSGAFALNQSSIRVMVYRGNAGI